MASCHALTVWLRNLDNSTKVYNEGAEKFSLLISIYKNNFFPQTVLI